MQWRSASGAVIAQAPAFDGFGGPATIATGDVNGDGVPDVAIAAGDGGGPRIRVMNGRTGALFVDFFAYDPDFRGGSNIALGDLNGDGKAELITGAGVGGGPHVRVFNPVTGELEREFFAYDPEARGGVHVAAGDLNGDHASEIITTPGAGEGGFLFVFDGTGTEKFRATVTAPESTGGTAVSAALDPLTNSVVVVVTPDDGGPLLRFRSQILVGDPLLVPIPNDPILLLPVAT